MALFWLLCSLFTGSLVVSAWPTSYPYDTQPKCEPIAIPMCLSNQSKYDKTLLPNFLGIVSQSAVKEFTEQKLLQDLVKTNCSKDVVFFLCAVLVPICISGSKGVDDNLNLMVPPCRSVCERVYSDCIQPASKLNISWPEKLNCSGLPDQNEGICIAPESFVRTTNAPLKLKATCASRSNSKLRRKNIDLNSANLKKYDYIFRAKWGGRRSGAHNSLVMNVLSQSKCTSLHLNTVSQLQLQRHPCRRKFKKSDGEVLIFARKVRKQVMIEKIVFRMKKDDMKKALHKHVCSSKRRNNKRQHGNTKG